MDRVHKTIAGTRHTITRRQVLAELARYDREYPANDYDERTGGPGWLDAATYHYALVHEGRLYPPKYLLHRLTGAPLDRFTGGEFTNGVFRRLGFDILPKGAALNRQARLLRELGGPPYAPPQAGVPARIADLPGVPAVYAMYGGQDAGLYVAYTGVARHLRRRVEQHLILHNSSVTAGAAAVALQPDHVREVRWWTHPLFADRDALEAAELVAFAVFDPVLRSRGAVREGARRRAEDAAFVEEMRALFAGEPAGRLVIPTLEDALARIEALERRVAEIEAGLFTTKDTKETEAG